MEDRMPRPPIRIERMHLDILRALAEHGTLTAAAASLHLTQSALSHSMGKLERDLGVPLWRRAGRRLHPTPAGEHMLAAANRIVPQFLHAEERLRQIAAGRRGTLRIGMECHPCYRWLQKIASPYLAAWPAVDMDVKQKFQFGGIGALIGYDIDLLVTPDPMRKAGLRFQPVFDYEQVLAVGPGHPLRAAAYARPGQLADETLITYPVPTDRLDIYTRFLLPAGITPRRHLTIETTDIMLQMVANRRGVAALPRWLLEEHAGTLDLVAVRLGRAGIAKQICLGIRDADAGIEYLTAFIDLARSLQRHAG
jgi:LysR family transcriptional regulator for metE and metH